MTKSVYFVFALAINFHVEAEPRLLFAQQQIDFGLIDPLTEQTRTIKIDNVGDTPLAIHRVRACCVEKAAIIVRIMRMPYVRDIAN